MSAWPPLPSVSTPNLYAMMQELPDATPSDIATAVVRHYRLDDKSRLGLRRRLSAMAYARRCALQEVGREIPVGDIDGNSAMVAIQRVAAIVAKERRPTDQPCE